MLVEFATAGIGMLVLVLAWWYRLQERGRIYTTDMDDKKPPPDASSSDDEECVYTPPSVRATHALTDASLACAVFRPSACWRSFIGR